MSTNTIGDVHATLTTCVLLDNNGEPCGQHGKPGLPLGVCVDHALAITRAVLKLGGIEVEEKKA